MRVLIVYPEVNPNDNPFVRTLMEGLRNLGCQVNWGRNEFWQNFAQYDVIHIHWPDAMFETVPPTDEEVNLLEKHYEEIRRSCRILYTRHNERPHYSQDPNRLKCYDLIEKKADAVVHMGHYDIDSYKKRLNNDSVKHFFIPHHTYDTQYDNTIPQKEAREKLKIPANKFVILSFGAFRDIEEANMVLSAFRKLEMKNKYLLAPRLIGILTDNRPTKWRMKWIMDKIISFKLKQEMIYTGSDFVDNDLLANYFIASDVVLIQRKQILNSGNVSLAFYFKKPVIGPNVGNVGELLKQTNNIVFDPDKMEALENALHKAETIASSDLGSENYRYAATFMTTEIVAKQYLNVYKNL